MNGQDVIRFQFAALEEELESMRARAEKAEAFKTWVHAYLDEHGVPHHPPGSHGAEGCRIGDRMDWLISRYGENELKRWLNEEFREACNKDFPRLRESLELMKVGYTLGHSDECAMARAIACFVKGLILKEQTSTHGGNDQKEVIDQ